MSDKDTLILLEKGHDEAHLALEAIQKAWEEEDRQRNLWRRVVLERHAQGARDRDQMRQSLGGASKLRPASVSASVTPVEPVAAAEPAAPAPEPVVTPVAEDVTG